jgi:hypothetical protein
VTDDTVSHNVVEFPNIYGDNAEITSWRWQLLGCWRSGALYRWADVAHSEPPRLFYFCKAAIEAEDCTVYTSQKEINDLPFSGGSFW